MKKQKTPAPRRAGNSVVGQIVEQAKMLEPYALALVADLVDVLARSPSARRRH